jgi:hypothetical protein
MKTITTIIFALAFLLATLLTAAQSKSDKIYDAFSGKEGVTNFTFSKDMIDAIDIDLGDDGDEKTVTGDLYKIKFLSYNPEKGSLSGNEFTKKAIAMLPGQYNKYEDDEDDDAEIWLLGKKKKYTECHVFTRGEGNSNRFIVSFYGDFNVNDIEDLKEKGRGFSEE